VCYVKKNVFLSCQRQETQLFTINISIMKKSIILTCLVASLLATPMRAQFDTSELPDPKPGPQEAWQTLKAPKLAWGTIDERYSRSQLPKAEKTPSLYAWRGERVSAQAILATPKALKGVTFEVSDLRCGRHYISSSNIRKYFVRYVLTDYYNAVQKDSFLMADRLSPVAQLDIDANTTRPLWLDIHVPQEAVAGKYTGKLTVHCEGSDLTLPISLTVGKRVLPEPYYWKFHLDLWQNPFSVARYYNVPLWSQQHFDLMRPIMTQLAQAGQKVITTSIIRHPWDSQTEDPFESMIVKMKHVDGTWSYDYTAFDKWVEFMMSCGITEQIDCYTIVPWGFSFEYIDMASSSLVEFTAKPGEKAYEDYLRPLLTDFAKHLKAKGWFARTCIAMDERPMDLLRKAWDLLRSVDPGYRIQGAINYSPELVSMMYDVCLFYKYTDLPDGVQQERKQAGEPLTFYTCCSPDHPNTFTFSPPAESAFLGWHAANLGYDGYLRWAYNSWTITPLQDSRYFKRNWLSGDCFFVYPGESSIRMERLVEGIQAYEKIRILREDGVPEAKLKALLAPFGGTEYAEGTDAPAIIRHANAMLRRFD